MQPKEQYLQLIDQRLQPKWGKWLQALKTNEIPEDDRRHIPVGFIDDVVDAVKKVCP